MQLPSATQEHWAALFPDCGIDLPALGDEIVLYCQAGVRSEVAAQHLRALGYTKVINYRGSWGEWSATSW